MSVPVFALAVGLVFVLLALNAFRPLFRPAPLTVLSFFPAWLTIELPLHHAVAAAAVAGLLAWAGALREWPGRLGFVLALGASIALVAGWLRGFAARKAVDDALREALGPRWEDFIDRRPFDRLPPHPDRWRWAAPFAVRRRGVEVLRDIVFAEPVAGVRLRLDLYRPRMRESGCPALLFVHGGAWAIGYKERQAQPMLYGLAAQGWVCATIDYRLSPRAVFPDHLIDVKHGLAWMRRHGPEYGADPGFLVVSGNSAGGNLAALAALTPNDPRYQPGFEAEDTSVDGCVAFYGVFLVGKPGA
jgi:acetyl esterase/lipase